MTHEQSDGEHISPAEASSEQTLPTQTRLARLGTRWRTSLPLRVATAVVVALLIGVVGFTTGTAFSGDNGHDRAQHEVTAVHPFWQDRTGWIHRHEHTMPYRLHIAPSAAAEPSAAPAH